jgi:phage tail-like protein
MVKSSRKPPQSNNSKAKPKVESGKNKKTGAERTKKDREPSSNKKSSEKKLDKVQDQAKTTIKQAQKASKTIETKVVEFASKIEEIKTEVNQKIEASRRLQEERKEAQNKVKANLQKYENYPKSLNQKIGEQITSPPQRPPEVHRPNYVTTNRFYIEIESQVRASFSECSGLGVNIKKETYFEGGVNNQQRIFLGAAEFTDVTLKRGMTDDITFWGWIFQALTGQKSRRNVNILLFNQAGETMLCWTLIGAIPVSWKTPALQADGNAVAIEELTLAYEGLQVKTREGGGGATTGFSRDGAGFFPSN